MKSNFEELFINKLSSLKHKGTIDAKALSDSIKESIEFDDETNVSEYLLDFWTMFRTVNSLNANDCYSYEKGKYISLDIANEKNLDTIDDRAKEVIKSREDLRAEIEKRRKNIPHQNTMHFDGSDFKGYKEEPTVEELLALIM